MTITQQRLRITETLEPIDNRWAKTFGIDVRRFGSRHASRYGLVWKEDAWLEVRLNDRWIVAYRLAIQRGIPIVSELRVFPFEGGKRQAGSWSGEWTGIRARPPRGGITGRLLRLVKPGQHADQLEEVLQKLKNKWGPSIFEPTALLGRLGIDPSTHARRGRKPRPDLEYARIAEAYVKKIRSADRRPVEAIAKEFKMSVPRARDFIHRARQRGFLSGTTQQGRPGGVLTDKARAILSKRTLTKGGKGARKGSRSLEIIED